MASVHTFIIREVVKLAHFYMTLLNYKDRHSKNTMLFLTNQILTDSLSIAYHLIIIVYLKFITLYFQENNGQKRIIKMYCNTGLSKEKR